VQRGAISAACAGSANADLVDVAIDYFPSLVLRDRAWARRENITAPDALFIALAERLGETLATKDRGLVTAATTHARVRAIVLAGG
jgi:predicted nucleic acid-binding protein